MGTSCWFHHDSNARNDRRILRLRIAFGDAGYAHYLILLEIMREEPGLELPFEDIEVYAGQMQPGMDAAALRAQIDRMIDIGLFASEGTCFWSDRLRREAVEFERIRQTKRDNARRRWEEKAPKKPRVTAAAKRPDSARNADALRKQCEGLEGSEGSEGSEGIDINTLMQWLTYKHEKGQRYKPAGLQALYKKWSLLGNDRFKAAVQWSMSNNYTGLFEEKTNGQKPGKARPEFGKSGLAAFIGD